MSREIRAVRPFDTLDETERLMREGVELVAISTARAADDLSDARHGQALQVSSDTYLHEEFQLFLFRHPPANEDLLNVAAREIRSLYGADSSIVHLVVQVHNKRLRMTDVVFDEPIVGGEIPLAITIATKDRTGTAPRPRALQTPGDGCEVVVELLLAADLPDGRRGDSHGARAHGSHVWRSESRRVPPVAVPRRCPSPPRLGSSSRSRRTRSTTSDE